MHIIGFMVLRSRHPFWGFLQALEGRAVTINARNMGYPESLDHSSHKGFLMPQDISNGPLLHQLNENCKKMELDHTLISLDPRARSVNYISMWHIHGPLLNHLHHIIIEDLIVPKFFHLP